MNKKTKTTAKLLEQIEENVETLTKVSNISDATKIYNDTIKDINLLESRIKKYEEQIKEEIKEVIAIKDNTEFMKILDELEKLEDTFKKSENTHQQVEIFKKSQILIKQCKDYISAQQLKIDFKK